MSKAGTVRGGVGRGAALGWACALVAWLCLCAPALAAVTVRADVGDRRVFVGQALLLNITVSGSRSGGAPDLSKLDGFEATYRGAQDQSRRSTTIVNGRRFDESYEGVLHQFELVPTRTGDLTIPPATVMVDGKAYETLPIQIKVLPPEDDDEIKLWLEIDNPTPYVGEPVRLRVTLGLLRDALNLRFAVPGLSGAFEVLPPGDFGQVNLNQTLDLLGARVPAVAGQRQSGPLAYATFMAERVVVPRKSGTLVVGPATVDAEVVSRSAQTIWDRRQTRRAVVPSQAVEIQVKPLPEAGRPANFNGLVGNYGVSSTASPVEVGVGDPISLEVRVTGPLVDSVRRPALENQTDLTERFRVTPSDNDGEVYDGTKIFRWTLRALRDDVESVPAVELPHFDTRTGAYVVAKSQEIPLKVRPTRVLTAADGEMAPAGGATGTSSGAELVDRAGGIAFNYEGPALLADQSFDLAQVLGSATGLAALGGPPLATGIAALVVALGRRSGRESRASRLKRALATARQTMQGGAGQAGAGAAGISAAVRGVVSAWSGEGTGAATSATGAGSVLTARECEALLAPADPALAARCRSLLDACDAAAFGGVGVNANHTAGGFAGEALAVVEAIERTPWDGRGTATNDAAQARRARA